MTGVQTCALPISASLSTDKPWLEAIAATIGPSLSVLSEAVEMSRPLMSDAIEMSEKAQGQLAMENVSEALKLSLEKSQAAKSFDVAAAKKAIKEVTKELGVKKGLVMKSLRAALTGELSGPDLIQSWVVLHQRGLAVERLQAAIG